PIWMNVSLMCAFPKISKFYFCTTESAALKTLCKEYYNRIYKLNEDKWDLELATGTKELEVVWWCACVLCVSHQLIPGTTTTITRSTISRSTSMINEANCK